MNKKKIWLHLTVLIVSILVYFGYAQITSMRMDTEAPTIEMEAAEISISVKDPESALLQGVSAYDNQDGDVLHSVIIESVYGMTEDHRATVTYAAFDKAGNVAKAQRLVHYTDYRSPRFNLLSAPVFEYGSTFDIMEIVGADDVIEGDITRRVKATIISKTTTISKEGLHEVQFRVTNSMGDSSDVVLPVEVYAADTYDFPLFLSDYLIYVSKDDNIDLMSYVNSFEFAGELKDLTKTWPQDFDVSIQGTYDPHTPGVYPITYTATYKLYDRIHMGCTKLIIIVEG